jgi:hypothetical protein
MLDLHKPNMATRFWRSGVPASQLVGVQPFVVYRDAAKLMCVQMDKIERTSGTFLLKLNLRTESMFNDWNKSNQTCSILTVLEVVIVHLLYIERGIVPVSAVSEVNRPRHTSSNEVI